MVACAASEVLKFKEGICFAKSHLLAAFLRYLGIPAGFCYQKLLFDDVTRSRLVLHGLNAIYLKSLEKWIRVDARGNKKGVDAEFLIEGEKLAFQVRKELGEVDFPVIYAEPNKKVVNVLKNSANLDELVNNLPSDL